MTAQTDTTTTTAPVTVPAPKAIPANDATLYSSAQRTPKATDTAERANYLKDSKAIEDELVATEKQYAELTTPAAAPVVTPPVVTVDPATLTTTPAPAPPAAGKRTSKK
jgi:putative intracellular protease/amidase